MVVMGGGAYPYFWLPQLFWWFPNRLPRKGTRRGLIQVPSARESHAEPIHLLMLNICVCHSCARRAVFR